MPEDMVKIKKESYSSHGMIDSSDHYPYGTQIDLSTELIEQLGIESLAPGDMVDVVAIAVVTRKSEHADESETEKSMCLQIQHMKVKRKDPDQAERVKQLYG